MNATDSHEVIFTNDQSENLYNIPVSSSSVAKQTGNQGIDISVTNQILNRNDSVVPIITPEKFRLKEDLGSLEVSRNIDVTYSTDKNTNLIESNETNRSNLSLVPSETNGSKGSRLSRLSQHNRSNPIRSPAIFNGNTSTRIDTNSVNTSMKRKRVIMNSPKKRTLNSSDAVSPSYMLAPVDTNATHSSKLSVLNQRMKLLHDAVEIYKSINSEKSNSDVTQTSLPTDIFQESTVSSSRGSEPIHRESKMEIENKSKLRGLSETKNRAQTPTFTRKKFTSADKMRPNSNVSLLYLKSSKSCERPNTSLGMSSDSNSDTAYNPFTSEPSSVSAISLREKKLVYANVLFYKSNPKEMKFGEISAVMERKLKQKTGYHSEEPNAHSRRLEICREALKVFIEKYSKFGHFLGRIRQEYEIALFSMEKKSNDRLKTIQSLKAEKDFLLAAHKENVASLERKYKQLNDEIADKLKVFKENIERLTMNNLSLEKQNEILMQQLDRQRRKNSLLVDLIRNTQDTTTVNICVALLEQIEQSNSPEQTEQIRQRLLNSQFSEWKSIIPLNIKPTAKVLPTHETPSSQSLKIVNTLDQESFVNRPRTTAMGTRSVSERHNRTSKLNISTYSEKAVEAILVPGFSSNSFDWEKLIDGSCLPHQLKEIIHHTSFEGLIQRILREYDLLYTRVQILKKKKLLTQHIEDVSLDQSLKQCTSMHVSKDISYMALEETDSLLSYDIPQLSQIIIPPKKISDKSGFDIHDIHLDEFPLHPTKKYVYGTQYHSIKEFRFVGKLKLLPLTFEQGLRLICDIFKMKCSLDSNIISEARVKPSEFVVSYLRKRLDTTTPAHLLEKHVFEYIYTLEHLCELHRHKDIDYYLFYSVVFEDSLSQDVLLQMDTICERLSFTVEKYLQNHDGKMQRSDFFSILDEFFPMTSNYCMGRLRKSVNSALILQEDNFIPWPLFDPFPDRPNDFLREFRRQFIYQRAEYLDSLEYALVLTIENRKEEDMAQSYRNQMNENTTLNNTNSANKSDAYASIYGDNQIHNHKIQNEMMKEIKRIKEGGSWEYIVTTDDFCVTIQELDPSKPLHSIDEMACEGFRCSISELEPEIQIQQRVYRQRKEVPLAQFMQRIRRMKILSPHIP